MKKQIKSVMLGIAFMLSMISPCFAMNSVEIEDYNTDVEIGKEIHTEIDDILDMREATQSDILKMGISPAVAEDVADTDIEGLFLERAKCSEDELARMGYTAEQIKLLKEYDGSPITKDSAIVRAAASMTSSISVVSASSSAIKFKYSWTWSAKPLYASSATGVGWCGYTSSNTTATTSARTSSLTYYSVNSGGKVKTSSQTPTYKVDGNNHGCIVKTSPKYTTDSTGATDIHWVKSGSVTVKVSSANSLLAYLRVSGKCVNYTKSGVSIGFSIAGVSISFTPSATSTSGYKTRRITKTGAIYND